MGKGGALVYHPSRLAYFNLSHRRLWQGRNHHRQRTRHDIRPRQRILGTGRDLLYQRRSREGLYHRLHHRTGPGDPLVRRPHGDGWRRQYFQDAIYLEQHEESEGEGEERLYEQRVRWRFGLCFVLCTRLITVFRVYNAGGGGTYIAGDSAGRSDANIINNAFIRSVCPESLQPTAV